MQTETSSLTYAIPFLISVVTWVKMVNSKKNISYINNNHIYIEKKLENLEMVINKNKSSIFNINNQIDYIYETLVNTKNDIKHATLTLENAAKINNINTLFSDFEILINQKIHELERRIKEIENRSLNIRENIHLKIVNPEFLVRDEMYSSYKQCQSPYNIIYTSSSTNISSAFSPSRNNEWISLP